MSVVAPEIQQNRMFPGRDMSGQNAFRREPASPLNIAAIRIASVSIGGIVLSRSFHRLGGSTRQLPAKQGNATFSGELQPESSKESVFQSSRTVPPEYSSMGAIGTLPL